MGSRRITIRDVARACGVSTYTVSSVLNEKGNISEATTAKVMRAVQEMGYHPLNHVKRPSRLDVSTLGLVLPRTDFSEDPFYFRAISAARSFTAANGHDLKLLDLAELDARLGNNAASPLALGFDHLVAFCCQPADACLRGLVQQGVPVALIRRQSAVKGLVLVGDEDREGIRLAVDHLYRTHGHRRIGFAGGRLQKAPLSARVTGYVEYVQEHGQLPVLVPMDQDGWQRNLLDSIRAEGLTALVCMDDGCAVRAAKVLLTAGIRVPDDVAIVGYNNDARAEAFHPGITTVDVPVAPMVTAACDALLGKGQRSTPARTVLQFDNSLVIRDSCGPHESPKEG